MTDAADKPPPALRGPPARDGDRQLAKGKAVRHHTAGHVLGQTVAGAAVPFGYTLSIWAAGALMMRQHGLPGSGDIFLFTAGALVGVRLAQLAADLTPREAGVPVVEVRLGTHGPALAAALAAADAASVVLDPALGWATAALLASVGYLLGLALARFLINWRHNPNR